MQPKDFREFRERMAGMPERLPALESGGEWHEMMHKSMEGMSYRAWRHVLPYGGTEYLSRTFFENSTVEEMCDFFNSDEVRASWDRLLYRHRVLERDERTGAEAVFWERALPVISNAPSSPSDVERRRDVLGHHQGLPTRGTRERLKRVSRTSRRGAQRCAAATVRWARSASSATSRNST